MSASSSDVFPRARVVFIALVVLPIAVLTGVWLWIRSERSKIREQGIEACARAGGAREHCAEMAARNHERCFELTYQPATRFSHSSFDERGYVECIESGSDAYWKESARRAAERRAARSRW